VGRRSAARGDQVLVELKGRGDAELEMWAANRQLVPLERELGRTVRLQVRIVDDQEAAARPAPAPAKPRRRRPPKPDPVTTGS
jgi:hypothetical protein